MSLLQRQWFRRIWVLQEVAAARHVRLLCGTTEIDGHAFSLGLEHYKNFPDTLQNQIRAVTYLMRGAIFRPKFVWSDSKRASLNICSLGELIDMYHTHESTQLHDKIYALLGMGSDDASEADLLPDYTISWRELLRRLVTFLLGEKVSIQTWENEEKAMIYGEGCVIGKIRDAKTASDGIQMVELDLSDILSNESNQGYARFTLQTMGNKVQEGDIVYLLQGSSNSMIIRPRAHYFSIITIKVTTFEYAPVRAFPRKTLLLWQWSQPPRQLEQDWSCAQDIPGTPARSWNVAMIMTDAREYGLWYHNNSRNDKEYEKAKNCIMESIQNYTKSTGEADDKIPLTETVLVDIILRFDEDVVDLLLERRGDEISVTENLVIAAAVKGWGGLT
ncbi:Nn.00g059240.m01.CDS01 [Neocucurbitaria sp. VM-36]